MRLSPTDVDKLLLSVAAMVARDRRARGVKLNVPEATALLSSFVLEGARDGRTVADLMSAGRAVLSRDDVMQGVRFIRRFIAEREPDILHGRVHLPTLMAVLARS